MTARPATSLPSLSRATRYPARFASEATVQGAVRLAPNFSAWMIGPLGELLTRDAHGKSQVVLDPRAHPGLPAGCGHLHAERAQPFGGSVDGRRQTGWAAPDDDQVEAVLRQALDRESEIARHIARGGPAQHGASGDDDGQLRRSDVELRQQRFHLGVPICVEPLVGDTGPGEELPDAEGFRGELLTR